MIVKRMICNKNIRIVIILLSIFLCSCGNSIDTIISSPYPPCTTQIPCFTVIDSNETVYGKYLESPEYAPVTLWVPNVNPDILWFNLWSFIEGSAFVISLTVLIFYGIYMGKSIIMLPVAMLIHAVSNASKGIFYIIDIPLTAVLCFAAYCCWQKMQSPYEIE